MTLHERMMERLFLTINPETASELFNHTWRIRHTPGGFPVLALRASSRKTERCHWPTTTTQDAQSAARHGYMITGNQGTTLLDAARMAGWGSPTAQEFSGGVEAFINRKIAAGVGGTAVTMLAHQASLTAWPTPNARDFKHGPRETYAERSGTTKGDSLGNLASAVCGPTATGSPAATASSGQLNPSLSRWLMGLPKAWDLCAPATSLRSKRSS